MEEVIGPLTWNNAMLISGVILAVTFVGIFTEAVHGFHRTKFAMGGAGLMILVGQYCQASRDPLEVGERPHWRSGQRGSGCTREPRNR